MGQDPIARRSFLAKGGCLLGGALVARALMDRLGLGELPAASAAPAATPVPPAAGASSLAKLRAAYAGTDVNGLIALLHPKVQWFGVDARAPG
jgi:hypothetical protein